MRFLAGCKRAAEWSAYFVAFEAVYALLAKKQPIARDFSTLVAHAGAYVAMAIVFTALERRGERRGVNA